ncbi:hypothetical protein [Klebsiella oxytoca]|uniref:Eaa1 n=1 Tax=Klebsiella oxytoca TaxID=571 RepID=A0AAD3URG9_KLEOX|nr:hypothetical protein [Klebsiella oxytoca]HAU4365825.1 hypothetical protein [Klebsiella oxytoca]HAU4381597.1 hypothetical protein [Klebsiella oxytoca]HAU4386181.1 hypothetical protein [Klebsiella oxytoca]
MTNNQLTENSITQLLNNVRLARDNAERADNRVDHSFYYALARALEELQERRKAAMDSEPVAYTDERNLGYIDRGRETAYLWGKQNSEPADVALYRHAQQPVVPPMQHWEELCREYPDMSIGDAIIRAAWWNHCRAAMLQAGNSPVIPGAEQRIADAVDLVKKAAPAMLDDNSGPDGPLAGRAKSPAIPDGYVLVPKEPTERMIIDGFESEPDETFSKPEVWEAYQDMSGCEQAAYRARLCWAAMLAAAPQEVK